MAAPVMPTLPKKMDLGFTGQLLHSVPRAESIALAAVRPRPIGFNDQWIGSCLRGPCAITSPRFITTIHLYAVHNFRS